MTRLMTTVAATALLALPAFAQAPSTSSAPPAAPESTQKPAAGPKAAAKPTAKPADTTTLEQGSTDRDIGAIEPAAGGKRKAAQRGDPESARIAELNRQQMQQIEDQQPRR